MYWFQGAAVPELLMVDGNLVLLGIDLNIVVIIFLFYVHQPPLICSIYKATNTMMVLICLVRNPASGESSCE